MPSEQDFLEVIQACPHDDVPRLVYADWLDEQGDPRAELIRLLVEVREVREGHEHWPAFEQCVKECFGVSDFVGLIDQLDDRQQRLFACQCAESVLHLFEQAYPGDERPRRAIAVARDFANERATIDELKDASRSAMDASRNDYSTAPERSRQAACCASNWYSPEAMNRLAVEAHRRADARFPAPAASCAEASAEAWGSDDHLARNQQLIWLVERLLTFKID